MLKLIPGGKMGPTVDEMWEVVRPYYESANRVRFTSRPTDHQIRMLYDKMNALRDSQNFHFSKNPDLKQKFHQSQGLIEGE